MKKLLSIACSICSFLPAFAQPESFPNVGIGTTTPTRAKLEVFGVAGSGATSAIFGSDGAGVSLQRNWPTIGFNQYRDEVGPGVQGKYISTNFAAIQYFDPGSGTFAIDMFPSGTKGTYTAAGVRAITVASNGNTGIRGAGTSASLVVPRGDGSNDGSVVLEGPTYWSHFHYSFNEDTYIRSGVAGGSVYLNKIPVGPVLVGTTSSHIGINISNPFYTIEVYQPSAQKAFTLVDPYNNRWAMACNFTNTLNNGAGVVLDFYYNNVGRGRFQYWNGAYVPLSDSTLKKDVRPLDPVLDKVKRLRPVRYEMVRHNPDHEKSIGFIAQEVRPLFPHLVRQVVDHNFEGTPINDALVMNYSGFGVLAIKALQEQEHQILDLEKQKQDLLSRLEKLEQRLADK